MIDPWQVQQIAEIVRRTGLDEHTVAALRARFSHIHFTHCLEDEVGGDEPAHRDAGFNLYLVDGRQHCLRITNDHAAATGLLLALIQDET